MKRFIMLAALAAMSLTAMAQSVQIERKVLGSGQPGKSGYENAVPLGNGTFHAPQYMPGFPTAATIYPRAVQVQCIEVGSKLACEGYHWLPEMGRGEYLEIVPKIAIRPVAAKPIVQEVEKKRIRE